MSTEKTEPTLATEGTEEERSAAHAATRRKLLKAGIAGAPVIITLRSGTAWAVSSCVERISAPSNSAANAALDSGREAILTMVSDATDNPPGPTNPAPMDPTDIDYQIHESSVSWTSGPEARKDFYYVAASAPSCYQSFCAPGGPGAGYGANGCDSSSMPNLFN